MPATSSTRLLMTLSAAFVAGLGVGALFLPQEILEHAGLPASAVPAALVQVAGALFFGFAILNWSARGTLLGGIYGRPIVLANFTHFAIGAITLVKLLQTGHADARLTIGLVAYAVFAAWFGYELFGPGPRTQ